MLDQTEWNWLEVYKDLYLKKIVPKIPYFFQQAPPALVYLFCFKVRHLIGGQHLKKRSAYFKTRAIIVKTVIFPYNYHNDI